MKPFTSQIAFLFSITLSLASAQADAETLDVVGKIIWVYGAQSQDDATVIRDDGHRERAGGGGFLYPGEKLVAKRRARIKLQLGGDVITVDAAASPYVIPALGSAGFSLVDDRYFWGWRILLAKQLADPPIFSRVRDGGGNSPEPALSTDALLPRGRQTLPAGATHAAILWHNGATRLTAKDDQGRVTAVDSGTFSFAVVPFLPGAGTENVTSDSGKLSWAVTIGGKPPSPPWWKRTSLPLSNAERLVRATWILKSGRSEWHLFALTELKDLSDQNVFIASQLWAAAVSYDLEAELSNDH